MPVPFCINVGHIQGGTWPSSVPDKTVIEGRIGVSPNETVEQAQEDLEKCISRVARLDPWLNSNPPLVEWFGSCWHSGEVNPEHESMYILKNNFADIMNREPAVEGAPWATDAAALNRFGNTPAIIFGPGEGQLAHQVNESILTENMLKTSIITAGFIIDWCGVN